METCFRSTRKTAKTKRGDKANIVDFEIIVMQYAIEKMNHDTDEEGIKESVALEF